jgi:Tfp pilus assembly protein PilO
MGRVDRFWMIGGAVAAALLAALAWFVFIQPQRGETAQAAEQAAEAQVRVGTLQHRLADLRAQNENLPRYESELRRNRLALPTTPASTDLLRQVQEAGETSGATVDALVVGTGNATDVGGAMIARMMINIIAEGTPESIRLFLDQLQLVQPRAVLITNTNLGPGAKKGTLRLSLSLLAFFAPVPTGAPAPPAGADGASPPAPSTG